MQEFFLFVIIGLFIPRIYIAICNIIIWLFGNDSDSHNTPK